MALGGIELIVPTPFVEEEMDNSVRTSLFVDVGNVWDTEFDYDYYRQFDIASSQNGELLDYSDWSLYRSSAGISVQWITPKGPKVFSFSKAIQLRDAYVAKFFTFNVGQTIQEIQD